MKLKNDPARKRPVVWVTGASRGIGLAIAREFAAIGCVVCLSGRSRTLLQDAVKVIIKLGGKAHAVPCDMVDPRSINNAWKTIVRIAGDPDVLVNNAGVTAFKSFLDTPTQEFEKIVRTNFLGNMYCSKAVLPAMVKKKNGAIVNIISHAAVKTFTNSSAYAASKTAVLGLGRVLREELRGYNIKVINVMPGAVETEMWHAGVRKKYSHRMMKPKSVAEAVVQIYRFPPDVVADEIILRPIMGDLD
jgi:3-oxoacyl-[acyl-carrier protein] reductase